MSYSYQTPLPPTVSAGWNDPPINLGSKTSGTGVLTSKYRRPVDPSIQVSNQMDGSQQLNQDSRGLTVNGLNRLHSLGNFSNVQAEEPFKRAASEEFRHHAVYDAFTVPSASSQQDLPQNPYPSNPYEYVNEAVMKPAVPMLQNFTAESEHYPGQLSKLPIMNVLPPAANMPIEANPTALIYTPPNMISEDFQKSITSPDPANYIPPTKAAGDVSLGGRRLVEFLVKATLRLPAGVTRDGIQLRIGHLDQLAASNSISDLCIKKLNFVVDALDRESYEEAMQFFDQFQAHFPDDARTNWAQGVRLLLQESLQYFRGGVPALINF